VPGCPQRTYHSQVRLCLLPPAPCLNPRSVHTV
jgi:hypothetical protein